MEEMEGIFKEFTNYLLNFGIVSVKSVKYIIQHYNSIKIDENSINIQEILAKILFDYIEGVTKEQLMTICLNVILKFAENRNYEKINSIKLIFRFYSKFWAKRFRNTFNNWNKDTKCYNLLRKELIPNNGKFISVKSFADKDNIRFVRKTSLHSNISNINKAYNKYLTPSKNNSSMLALNRLNKSAISNRPDFKVHKNITTDFSCNKSKINTSVYSDFEDSLSVNCTFKPSINNKTKRYQTSKEDAFERLFNDKKFRDAKNSLKAKEKMQKDIDSLTFKPSINQNSSFSDKDKAGLTFYERQEDYYKSKTSKLNKLSTKVEESFNKVYTFEPTINNSNRESKEIARKTSNSESNVYNRLYQQSQAKRNAEKVENKQKQVIRTNSASKLINYSKINQLHEDHKKKNESINRLKQSFDEEDGLTFHPFINKEIKVNTTFQQRNFNKPKEKKQSELLARNPSQKNFSKYTQKINFRNDAGDFKDKKVESVKPSNIAFTYTKDAKKVSSSSLLNQTELQKQSVKTQNESEKKRIRESESGKVSDGERKHQKQTIKESNLTDQLQPQSQIYSTQLSKPKDFTDIISDKIEKGFQRASEKLKEGHLRSSLSFRSNSLKNLLNSKSKDEEKK